jgi:hypothetical protein
MEYFGNRFSRRLIDFRIPRFHDETRKIVMTFVVNTTEEEDESKLIKGTECLAHSHNKVGVKTVECKVFTDYNYFS